MKQKFIILNLLCFLLGACTKKPKNNHLAKNYFQQSVLAAEKNKREALSLVEQSLKLDPTPRAYALKATLLYQIGKYEESLSLFEKVIKEKSTPLHLKADVSNNYACNLLVLGQIDKAKDVWLELTDNRYYISPEVAWFNLGLLDFGSIPNQPGTLSKPNKLKLEQAVNYFKKAIKLNTDYIDSYYYLSLALVRLNRLEEAKESLIQIIGIMPEHQGAQNLMKAINQPKKPTSRR